MFQDEAHKPQFRDTARFLMSDVVVGLECVGENSIKRMNTLAGPDSPTLAKEGTDTERMSIRAVFGLDTTKNAIHVSKDEHGY